MTRAYVIRWLFFGGFWFLVGVGVWAVVTITRMKREQAIALSLLRLLAARTGLKEAIDHLQSSTPSAHT